MGKWIALGMIAVGIILVIRAVGMDHQASFEDGSFLFEIIIGAAGAVGVVGGVIWLAVLLFMGL